jgi:hypothetical protein
MITLSLDILQGPGDDEEKGANKNKASKETKQHPRGFQSAFYAVFHEGVSITRLCDLNKSF